jgi:hypothetical protein
MLDARMNFLPRGFAEGVAESARDCHAERRLVRLKGDPTDAAHRRWR